MALAKQVGSEFRQAMLHYVAALVEKRDWAGVVAYCESNRKALATATDTTTGEILHHVANAYASLTNYPAALKSARTAQSLLAAGGDSVRLAELFVTLGNILRDAGELREAEKAFRDAESIFRRNDCPEGQSRALNLLAGLFYRQNDYKNALAALMDALEIARHLDDPKKLAFMMGNIGRIYTFTGDFGEAKRHLKINIEMSAELGDSIERVRAEIALGYVHLQEGDYKQALAILQPALETVERLELKRDAIICRTYLGELHYRTGQLDESRSILEKTLAQATKVAGADGSLTGRVRRHLAELFVRLKKNRLAQQHASRAMSTMDKSGDRVEYGALLKIKAILADMAGKKTEGRDLMAKAIDTLHETGVRFEIAEARMASGKSTLYKRRYRLTHLFHAEEFYAHYGMQFKLLEVQKAIAEIDLSEPAPADNRRKPIDVAKKKDYLTANVLIKQIKKQLAMIGKSDLPVLLTGETGVGKDHMARYFRSVVRPDGPYVAINCASIPKDLLESELFGYKKGAFTGADGHKRGLFVEANGGVLLLDEIGDMPLELQTKLLGVLESREVTPLGTTRKVKLDIRVVAATNQDLEAMVEAGQFRRDLYYRLSGICFDLPPLRERKEDIPLLLQHFLRKRGLLGDKEKVSRELLYQFVQHDWPGNIRELDNQVRRLEVMASMVADGDLAELSRSIFNADQPRAAASLYDRVEQLERQLLVEALVSARGNKSEAARMLGIHEATVRTKLRRYAISVEGGTVADA